MASTHDLAWICAEHSRDLIKAHQRHLARLDAFVKKGEAENKAAEEAREEHSLFVSPEACTADMRKWPSDGFSSSATSPPDPAQPLAAQEPTTRTSTKLLETHKGVPPRSLNAGLRIPPRPSTKRVFDEDDENDMDYKEDDDDDDEDSDETLESVPSKGYARRRSKLAVSSASALSREASLSLPRPETGERQAASGTQFSGSTSEIIAKPRAPQGFSHKRKKQDTEPTAGSSAFEEKRRSRLKSHTFDNFKYRTSRDAGIDNSFVQSQNIQGGTAAPIAQSPALAYATLQTSWGITYLSYDPPTSDIKALPKSWYNEYQLKLDQSKASQKNGGQRKSRIQVYDGMSCLTSVNPNKCMIIDDKWDGKAFYDNKSGRLEIYSADGKRLRVQFLAGQIESFIEVFQRHFWHNMSSITSSSVLGDDSKFKIEGSESHPTHRRPE